MPSAKSWSIANKAAYKTKIDVYRDLGLKIENTQLRRQYIEDWQVWKLLCKTDFCIGCVEDGLHHEDVHTSFHQTLYLLSIRWYQFIKCCKMWTSCHTCLHSREFGLLMFLYSGFSTEGERERVLFVGPTEPMQNRRIPMKWTEG